MVKYGSFLDYVYKVLYVLGVYGFHNVVALLLLVLCIRSISKSIKRKTYVRLILPILLTGFLSYSLFTMEGSLRLLYLQLGYPRVAYTFPNECIKPFKQISPITYIGHVETEERDIHNQGITPLITILKIGPFRFSKLKVFM